MAYANLWANFQFMNSGTDYFSIRVVSIKTESPSMLNCGLDFQHKIDFN